MAVEPEYPLHAELSRALDGACSPARVPEGQGGQVFVDGSLHRILDMDSMIKGESAFCYSVNEKELSHLCRHVDVANLGFKGLRTTTIMPLRELPRLRRLSLWWVQKLADLSPLVGMALETLVLDDLRYANDISALAEIPGLRALTIAGGMSTTQRVETLQPLTALPDLRELRLMAIKLDDDSLRHLAHCAALTALNLPNTFPTEEYAYLVAKRPDIRCLALAAYQTAGYISDGKNIMVTGRRKPYLSDKKDAARLAKYQAQFDAMVADFRSGEGDG